LADSGVNRIVEPSFSHSRPPFGLFLEHFEPSFLPDALNPLVNDLPAFILQKSRHSLVAAAAEAVGQVPNPFSQIFFADRLVCAPGLPDDTTGAAFGDIQHLLNLLHGLPAPPGHRWFLSAITFFESTSFNIALSRDKSPPAYSAGSSLFPVLCVSWPGFCPGFRVPSPLALIQTVSPDQIPGQDNRSNEFL